MKWFSRKREKAGTGIWAELDAKQQAYAHRLADWLGRRAATVPQKRSRRWVIGALLSVALLNGVSLVLALSRRRDHPPPLVQGVVMSVHPPRQPHNPGQSLKHYLDSLRADPVGSRLLDSLLVARPGLADTIWEAEEMAP